MVNDLAYPPSSELGTKSKRKQYCLFKGMIFSALSYGTNLVSYQSGEL